jgi:hypothetical protein
MVFLPRPVMGWGFLLGGAWPSIPFQIAPNESDHGSLLAVWADPTPGAG